MTTIEHTRETVQLDTERQVFLAENGRRARILGVAAKVAFVVTVLWLAALAAGMLGFGQLPGTSIEQPFSRLISGDASKHQAPSVDSESASVTAFARERSARAQTIAGRRSTPAGTPVRRPRSRPALAQPTQPAQPAPGQAAVARQPRQQGWTRHGYVAPPGQVRLPQPPAPKPGNGYGRMKKTTAITSPQPPPPPPGTGNGNGGTKLK
jgi:hypothetical protein